MEWLQNQIKVEPPKKPKKCTGTRFASILGLNRWSTPFETWCEITRTYAKPFEDTIYTIAGKIIEPKQIEYMKQAYLMDNLKTPTDIYGQDYFKKTWGDFFPNTPIFGGMWDSLLYENGKPESVIEFKTTKRAEDWKNGAPEYYALQAALYAYLLGVDNVIMVASFLGEENYEHPELFVPSADNTMIDDFLVSERFPQFQAHIDRATDWWDEHVIKGISPKFDEKEDADILKELRKNNVTPDTDLTSLIAEGEKLKAVIDRVTSKIADKEKRLKEITDLIKKDAITRFRDGDKQVSITGRVYEWVVSKSADSDEIDKAALKKDGLLDKYSKIKPGSYRITQKLIKEK